MFHNNEKHQMAKLKFKEAMISQMWWWQPEKYIFMFQCFLLSKQ
jgi:hypothetical protein